jgi:S-adenosylmethionine synthetase
MANRFLFTSEQVSDGHPDKMCDYVSDSILDALLALDPYAKVACETLIKNNTVIVAGEIMTTADINYDKVIRDALTEIGYDDEEVGFNPMTARVEIMLDKQSPEIANSVHVGKEDEDIGAGDQGLMIGYATDESPEFMPLTLVYSTRIINELRKARLTGTIPWLRPDAKSQVTLEYERDENGNIRPVHAHTILVSTQHAKDVSLEEIQTTIKEKILDHVIPKHLINEKTQYFINPSGSFVVGGPKGDCGVTGRKIIADSYGGWGGHGGGAFSGKDATKVDRSGAYAARWIAKSLVYNGYCSRCIVQVAYGIGISHPISVFVDTMGTVKNGLKDSDLSELVLKNFDLRPGMIIKNLELRRPIYKATCLMNHFMPKEDSLWEIPKIL